VIDISLANDLYIKWISYGGLAGSYAVDSKAFFTKPNPFTGYSNQATTTLSVNYYSFKAATAAEDASINLNI